MVCTCRAVSSDCPLVCIVRHYMHGSVKVAGSKVPTPGGACGTASSVRAGRGQDSGCVGVIATKRPLNPWGYSGRRVLSTPEEERSMCRQVTCRRCGNATWSGCGQHVDQVMAGVPKSKRCECPPKPSFVERIFGGRKSSV